MNTETKFFVGETVYYGNLMLRVDQVTVDFFSDGTKEVQYTLLTVIDDIVQKEPTIFLEERFLRGV